MLHPRLVPPAHWLKDRLEFVNHFDHLTPRPPAGESTNLLGLKKTPKILSQIIILGGYILPISTIYLGPFDWPNNGWPKFDEIYTDLSTKYDAHEPSDLGCLPRMWPYQPKYVTRFFPLTRRYKRLS